MAIAPPHADSAQALYERYYPNVYRYALSQLRSPQDAEDAAQNTFLRAFAALQKGAVPHNEPAWLFKIAHNVCASSKLAWLRRRRVETPRDLDLLPVEPRAAESRRDELAGLEDALASMPPRLREAFLLREWQGLSYDEIAERLDTSRSAVETLIFRARRHLATQLRSLLPAPLLTSLRGLFESAPAVVKAAGAVAIVAGAGAVAEPLITKQAPVPVPAERVPAAVVETTPTSAAAATTQHRARAAQGGAMPTAPGTAAVTVQTAQATAPAVTAPGATAPAGPAAPPSDPQRTGTGAAPATTPAVPVAPPAAGVPAAGPSLPTAATPAATAPTATLPSTPTTTDRVPPIAVPPVTVPPVTVPAPTTPAATTPAMTVPSVTVPGVTVPGVTVPGVTVTAPPGGVGAGTP